MRGENAGDAGDAGGERGLLKRPGENFITEGLFLGQSSGTIAE